MWSVNGSNYNYLNPDGDQGKYLDPSYILTDRIPALSGVRDGIALTNSLRDKKVRGA